MELQQLQQAEHMGQKPLPAHTGSAGHISGGAGHTSSGQRQTLSLTTTAADLSAGTSQVLVAAREGRLLDH